jgi:hypothetical protein
MVISGSESNGVDGANVNAQRQVGCIRARVSR